MMLLIEEISKSLKNKKCTKGQIIYMSDNQLYLDDEQWNKTIKLLKEYADQLLLSNEHVQISEIVGKIVALLNKLPSPLANQDKFVAIRAFASEITHIPTHQARQYWNSEALKKLDSEFKSIEEHFHNAIIEACKAILAFDFDDFRSQWLKNRTYKSKY